MRYELFLRRERALDEGELAALRERVAGAPGINLEVVQRGGTPRGVDLAVEIAQHDGAAALCEAAFALAAAYGLSVYDPQLAATVTAADGERVARRFAETAAYAEAAIGGPPPPPRSLAPGARAWLTIGAGIAALVLLGKALTCALP